MARQERELANEIALWEAYRNRVNNAWDCDLTGLYEYKKGAMTVMALTTTTQALVNSYLLRYYRNEAFKAFYGVEYS